MSRFGELKRPDLRSIWKHEANDFTPWLAKNIQRLGEALGMELELTDKEVSVGKFSLDLLAKDLGTGRTVVIENQFGATDHDHLGKLLTYAGGFDATTVVWLGENIRDEHRQALEWLNQRTDSETQFFGVIAEILQIDDSKPAYNFRPVVFPNEWQKTRRTNKPTTSRGDAYRAYFQQLIDELRDIHKFTRARAAQPMNWYTFASGISGFGFGANFNRGNRTSVELYIDREDVDVNERLFDQLLSYRAVIEDEYGSELNWEKLDGRRACRISDSRDGSILDTEETLLEIRAWHVEKLLLLKKALLPRLKECEF